MTNETKEKYFKIPFIWTNAKVVSAPLDFNLGKVVKGNNKTGLDFNVLGKIVEGDNKTGLEINLVKVVGGDNKAGLDIDFYKGVVEDNKTGLDVNYFKGVRGDNKTGLEINLVKVVGGDNKTGLDINIIKEVEGDDFGINASIICSKVGSVNKGALSYATFYNGINKVGDYGVAIQTGIYNEAVEVSDKGAVLQLGLFNKIGNNYFLFVNAKGLKNIPEIIKRKFSKKEKNLESKLNNEQGEIK